MRVEDCLHASHLLTFVRAMTCIAGAVGLLIARDHRTGAPCVGGAVKLAASGSLAFLKARGSEQPEKGVLRLQDQVPRCSSATARSAARLMQAD